MFEKTDDYLHLRHSKTKLVAHIILVTKYRKTLTAKGLWLLLKRMVFECCDRLGWQIIEIECDKDHLHILAQHKPTDSISKIVSSIKQYTTWNAWKQYSRYLKRLYWKERTLLSDGFFACSVGEASQKTVEEYIRNQG